MTAWQPIETAPKDGTLVLLGVAGEGFVATGHYVTDARALFPSSVYGPHFFPLHNATHWQPIEPLPPSALAL